MNCTAFSHELRRNVERRIDELPSEMEGHAADCPQCRRLWESSVLLDKGIARWQRGTPHCDPVDRDRFLAKLRQARPAIASAPSRRGLFAITVAATTLAIMACALLFSPRSPSPTIPRSEQDIAGSRSAGNHSHGMTASAPEDDLFSTMVPLSTDNPLALVARLSDFVPGPWEFASEFSEWTTDATTWPNPSTLLPIEIRRSPGPAVSADAPTDT